MFPTVLPSFSPRRGAAAESRTGVLLRQEDLSTNAAGTPAVVNMPPTGAGIRRIMNAAT